MCTSLGARCNTQHEDIVEREGEMEAECKKEEGRVREMKVRSEGE